MDAVVNLKHEPRLREEFEYAHVHNNTVLVDRRTKWGNEFKIGRDGSRERVVALYRADLWRRIRAGEVTLEELADLDGYWLACWCDPLPCHAHVLARAAAWASGRLTERVREPGSGAVHVRQGGGEHSSRRDVQSCHACSLRQPLTGSSTPLALRSGRGSE